MRLSAGNSVARCVVSLLLAAAGFGCEVPAIQISAVAIPAESVSGETVARGMRACKQVSNATMLSPEPYNLTPAKFEYAGIAPGWNFYVSQQSRGGYGTGYDLRVTGYHSRQQVPADEEQLRVYKSAEEVLAAILAADAEVK